MSSDWFDMNLKGKPNYIKEVSMFSLIDITSPEFKEYLDSSLHSVILTKEYYFDSLGYISRTIEKSTNYYFDSSNDTLFRYDKHQYKDSIVQIKYSPDYLLFRKEILRFNENGFCVRIDYSGSVNGFVEYKRDENNRIILSHEDITLRDTRQVTTENFQRNNNGDVVTKDQTIENHYYTGDTIETEKKMKTTLMFMMLQTIG